MREVLIKLKNNVVQSINEKINESHIFDDYFWNVDNEIENLEQMMNYHSLCILENFLKQFINDFLESSFIEFESRKKEIFSKIDRNFWNLQQNIYNKFINEKEEILFRHIKGFWLNMKNYDNFFFFLYILRKLSIERRRDF